MELTVNKYIGRKEEKERGRDREKDEEREESPWITAHIPSG